MFIPGAMSNPDARVNFYMWLATAWNSKWFRKGPFFKYVDGMQIFSYNSEEICSQMSTWGK